MRSKKIYSVFIILLLVLMLALLGCTDNTIISKPPEEGGNPSINIERVLSNIKTAFEKTNQSIEKRALYSVESSYSIDFSRYKYTLKLNANFNEEIPAASTIYFKLFDDTLNVNRLMCYYTESNLYLDFMGDRAVYTNFGASTVFQTFYNIAKSVDFSRFLFSDTMLDALEDITFLQSLIQADDVIDRQVGDNGKYVEIRNVNLDSVKGAPNTALSGMLSPFGNKIDAITEPVLGLKFSELSNVQMDKWTADKLSVATTGNIISTLAFDFSGDLNIREAFTVSANVSIGDTERKITPDAMDDPLGALSKFIEGNFGNYALTGTLTIGGKNQLINETKYDVEIQMKNDGNYNDRNKAAMLLRPHLVDKIAAKAFYLDEVLYVDLGEIMTMLGNGFGLKEMNFPKVKTSDVNLSQMFAKLMKEIETLVSGVIGDGSGVTNEMRDMLLKKISSDKDGYLNICVDKELITYLGGGEQNVVQYLAQWMGLDEATVQRYFNSEVFDNVMMKLRLNVETRNIQIILSDGNSDVVTLSLNPVAFDEAVLDRNIETYANDVNDYKDFAEPETLGLQVNGRLTTSAALSDFSKFFGAFIGDYYGKNTPITLHSNEVIDFRVQALQQLNGTYQVHALISGDHGDYLELWGMDEGGVPMLYIDYRYLNFKYKMPAAEVQRAMELALGDDNLLLTGDLIQIFSKLMSISNVSIKSDEINFRIYPVDGQNDILASILNVRGLSADFNASIRYAFDEKTFLLENKDAYIVPVLQNLSGITANSLYDASWHEKIAIAEMGTELYIPYDPDSVRIVAGKNVYFPTGRLFGQEISYYLRITDLENGTKEILRIKNESWVIDPWTTDPYKDTLDVVYTDGSTGKLKFTVDDFLPSLITAQGLENKKYLVRFGREGSTILSAKIYLDIEVEVRTLDYKTSTYPSGAYEWSGDYVVVGSIIIDPLAFAENPRNILPETINLRFRDMRNGSTAGAISEELFAAQWDYDYSNSIVVEGSNLLAYLSVLTRPGSAEEYSQIKMAYRVIVKNKQFDYFKVVGENDNTYTVDVLNTSSYTIPTTSTKERELRIYFKDGTFRTVGDPALDFEYNVNRNGYFPTPIEWKYKVADNIHKGGSSNPLGGGTANENVTSYTVETKFNDQTLAIGKYNFVIIVTEPASALVRETSAYGVLSNNVGESVERNNGSFDYHRLDLGLGFDNGKSGYFDFDPYNPVALPSTVKVAINTAKSHGEDRIVVREYPVIWQTDTNVIDARGMLRFPSAEEKLFRVSGIIGDGTIQYEIVGVIHNIESKYKSIDFYRETADGALVPMASAGITINAYEPYLLPTVLKLTLEGGQVQEIRNVQWAWQTDNTKVKSWSVAQYDAYKKYLADPAGTNEFRIMEYYKNPSANDGVGYMFQNVSGTYDIKMSVSQAEGGIYENEIPYAIFVNQVSSAVIKTALGAALPDGSGTQIDPYTSDSETFLNQLTAGYKVISVQLGNDSSARFYPVVWDELSLETMLTKLKSGQDSSATTLKGKIFPGIEGLEQSVEGNFVVMDRTISNSDGIRFSGLNTLPSGILSYTITNNADGKRLNIKLEKPYALTLENRYCSPYDYLREALKSSGLVFTSGQFNTFATEIDFGEFSSANLFNYQVLNFPGGGQTTVVGFKVYFSATGSTEDCIEVILETAEDKLTETVGSVVINRFDANGTPLYSKDGYFLEESVTLNFSASGKILFPVQKWTLAESGSADAKIDKIPVSAFSGFDSVTYNLLASLNLWAVIGGSISSSIEMPYNYDIVAARINETQYSGTSEYTHNGQSYTLNINNGVITFPTVFDFYGIIKTEGSRQVFDTSKLPTVIKPNQTGSYGQSNTFTVTWKTVAVLTGDAFAEYFNSGVQIATATIKGYDSGSTQTVSLFVHINDRSITQISQTGYDFSYDAGGLVLTIDPYSQTADGYALWETTLPDTVNVTMVKDGLAASSVSAVKYKFATGSATVQKHLLYNFTAFENNAKGSNTLNLVMVLENNEELPFTVKLIDKTVQNVEFEYASGSKGGSYALSDKTIFIDPYATFEGLPTKANVIFTDTAAELNISLLPIGTELRVSYEGGVFDYQFLLYGYRKGANGYVRVESPQTVPVKVVVVPRVLKEDVKQQLEADVVFENGIQAMLSDITAGKGLASADFKSVNLGIGIPEDMYLELPKLNRWYKPGNVEVTDQDFLPGMELPMEGYLGDKTGGETLHVKVSAYELAYAGFGIRNAAGSIDIAEDVPFNVFNAKSVVKTYTLWFTATNKNISGEGRVFDLYIDFKASDVETAERRCMIQWPKTIEEQLTDQAQVTETFRYGNAEKNLWYTGESLNFKLYLVKELTVDFGYNTEENPGLNQKTIFVVDPMNPQFPETAEVSGLVDGVRISFGKQPVVWANNAYTKNNFYAFEKDVEIKITPALAKYTTAHYIKLINLDRSSYSFTVDNSTYGGTALGNGMYDVSSQVNLDPTFAGIFNADTNKYTLPKSVTLRFIEDPNASEIVRKALEGYGTEFKLTDINWWLGSENAEGYREITLAGNEGKDPWPMVLSSARFAVGDRNVLLSDLPKTQNKKENPFATTLVIKNRAPISSNVTGDKVGNVFTASEMFAVDPYNVASSLPTLIDLYMGSMDAKESLTSPVWRFNASDIKNDMIEGTSSAKLQVELKLYADWIKIQFPVKPRKLSDQLVNGYIDGGTFYAVVGTLSQITEQLPKSMFFNFGTDSVLDYTSVPLKYTLSILANDIVVGKTYDCTGTIGVSTQATDNFKFKVKIVSPKLYALADIREENGQLTSYRRLDYYYDQIPVPVNSTGQVIGLESVRNALPNYLWLADNMTPIKITAKNLTKDEAEFKAQYSFATQDTVHKKLAVNKEGDRNIELSYTLPVVANATTSVFEQPVLDASNAGEDGKYHFDLGKHISSSQLPRAIYNDAYYTVIWDMSGVNVNRAFDNYQITGTLIIDDQKIYNFVITLAIDRDIVSEVDIVIPGDSLKFTYSGEEQKFDIRLPNIIGTDGATVKPHYTLTYAVNDGSLNPIFAEQQDFNAGKYLLKVTIDDINATGSAIFEFEITKMRISNISWDAQKEFTYAEGTPQAPKVIGLPDWVKRTFTYLKRTATGGYEVLDEAPINAGTYEIRITIPEQDNCYAIGETVLLPTTFTILPKNPDYRVQSEMQYNGTFRHAIILGLPSVLEANMSVTYRYYDENNNFLGTDMIRNVGNYRVEFDINGGDNYTSAQGLAGNIVITKANLEITVGDVQSYYLQNLLPFNSNVKYSNPVGSDTMQNFSPLVLTSDVTSKSVKGRYLFAVQEGSMTYRWNGVAYDNYNIIYNGIGEDPAYGACYEIKIIEGANVAEVQGATELGEKLAALKTGDSVSYYLTAGDYGDIVINVAAQVTLVGCYETDENGNSVIAVTANSITVKRGSLQASILKFEPKAKCASLTIEYLAGNVTLENCEFIGADTLNIPGQSTAIYAARGYNGTISLTGVAVAAYAVGINAESGNLTVYDCSVISCNYGISVQSGNVQVARSLLAYNTDAALVINGEKGSVSVNGCEFNYNLQAIRYSRSLTLSEFNELQGENSFGYNRYNLVRV